MRRRRDGQSSSQDAMAPQKSLPYTEARTIHLTTPDGYSSSLPLPHPVHIFPRFSLDRYVREWAIQSGVRFIPERARKFENDGSGWSIATPGGTHGVDYLIGADGATSKVRATVTRPFASSDPNPGSRVSPAGIVRSRRDEGRLPGNRISRIHLVLSVRGSLVDRNRQASAGNTRFGSKEKTGKLYCRSLSQRGV